MRGPGDRGEGLRGQQLAGEPVDHVEEAVLRRLQQHLARPAANGQIGEDHRLRGVVVPVVARRGLVVPDVAAGVGVERDDRREIQVVAAAGTAVIARPRGAVAGTDVDEIGGRVVGQAVPRRAAAAVLPPLALPALEGHLHRSILEALGRIARHDEPAPRLLARGRVVGREEAADPVLAAAVADHDLALHDARRAGDAVVAAHGRSLHRPRHVAGVGVEGHQPAVEQAHIDAALIDRHAAIDRAAAVARATFGVAALHERRVPAPLERAGARVHGIHDTPGRGAVEHAVRHDWRRFDLALRAHFYRPHGLQARDVGGVDLREGTVMRLGVITPVRDPLAGRRRHQHGVVNGLGLLARERNHRGRGQCQCQQGRRESSDAHQDPLPEAS